MRMLLQNPSMQILKILKDIKNLLDQFSKMIIIQLH